MASAATFITADAGGKLRNTAIYGDAKTEDYGEALLKAYMESTSIRRTHFGVGHLHNEVFLMSTSGDDLVEGCSRGDQSAPFRFWSSEVDGEIKYHAGWPNDLTPNTDYNIKASWNHFLEATSVADWLDGYTTCGCSTSDPTGSPDSLRILQTKEDIKFKFVDLSGCESGFNFFRKQVCDFNPNVLFTGQPIGDVSVSITATDNSAETQAYTIAVHDPRGEECGSAALPEFDGEDDTETVVITTGACVFDGCPPEIRISLNDGEGIAANLEFSRFIISTVNDATVLVDTESTESIGGDNPIGKVVVVPTPLEQDSLDVEYVRTSECFEQHFTSRSGDPIDDEALFNVGNVLQYCLRAVGTIGDDAYASPQVCTNHRVRFQSTVSGRILTESGVGVRGVSVSGHLLEAQEDADGSIAFAEVINRRRRRRRMVITESFDWRLDRNCPAQAVARDENGRPLIESWNETASTLSQTLNCPVYGLQLAATVSRRCGADGRWGEPVGACESALRGFTEVVGYESLVPSDLLTRISPSTLDACAWECLWLSEDCRGLQFVVETQTCILIRGTKLASLPEVEEGGEATQLYSLDAEVVTETRPLSAAPSDAVGPAVWCTGEDAPDGDGSPENPFALGARVDGGLAHDDQLGAFFEFRAQLDTVGTAGCTHMTGNLVVRGHDDKSLVERCRLHIQRRYADMLCEVATEENIAEYEDGCVESPDFSFGVEHASLLAKLTRQMRRAVRQNSTLLSDCALPSMTEIHDLNALKKITFVKGAIVIQHAARLRNMDGGLANLKTVGGTWTTDPNLEPVHLTVADTGLRGGLRWLLPSIRETLVAARFTDNAELCVENTVFEWPSSWIISGNANVGACGCTAPVANNYNPLATVSDSSCTMTACTACQPGTFGPCSYSDNDGDQICREALDAREPEGNPKFLRCPVGSLACSTDLCDNVVCNNPPQCQLPHPDGDANGKCDQGVCQYVNADEGAVCDDSDPLTGPDTCNSIGECVGKTSCVVADVTGVEDADYGGSVRIQEHIDAVAGCVIIDGNLHIDCQGNGSVTDLSPLSTIRGITGGLAIENCPGLTTAAPGLSGLENIAGEALGSSVYFGNNINLVGSFGFDAPNLANVEGTLKFVNNTNYCVNLRKWHLDWTDFNNADPGLCGCTQAGMKGFDAAHSFDDGSCEPIDLCDGVTCEQVNSCAVLACNAASGVCDVYTPLAAGTSCDDGNGDTGTAGVCAVPDDPASVAGSVAMACRATEPPDEVPQCHRLDFCDTERCVFRDEVNGVSCDDALDYTTGDRCVNGVCTPTDEALCFKPDDAPVVEIRAEASGETICRASIASYAPGSVISFDVHSGERSDINKLIINLYDELQGSSDTFDNQGHWLIELVPNNAYMQANCKRSCYDRGLGIFREDKGLENAQHLEWFFEQCGHPDGHCTTNESAPVPEISQCINEAPTDLCEAWASRFGCNDPADDLLGMSTLPNGDIRYTIVAQPEGATPTISFTLQAAASVSRADGKARVSIWHFNNRNSLRYAHATTDDAGAFELPFLTPHRVGSDDVSVERVSIHPFAVAIQADLAFVHTFGTQTETLKESGEHELREAYRTEHSLTHRDAVPVEVTIVDTATFAVQGNVSYAGQSSIVNNGDGCPAPFVEICAYQLPETGLVADIPEGQEALECVESEEDGSWLLAIVVGSNVAILQKIGDAKLSVSASEAFAVSDAYVLTNLQEDQPGLNFGGKSLRASCDVTGSRDFLRFRLVVGFVFVCGCAGVRQWKRVRQLGFIVWWHGGGGAGRESSFTV